MNRKRPSASASPKRCCVVSAWAPELDYLMDNLPSSLRPGLTLASVGVGLVEAAVGTTRLIARHRPHALLLVGTAGLYPGKRPALALGSAAAISDTVLLAQILPGKHAYLPDLVPTRQRTDPALTHALARVADLPLAEVACPLAITVTTKAAATAARVSGCPLENLEAFAVARAACLAGVPFAAVLGVANHVGPAGHREWKRTARQAAATACEAVSAWLRSRS